MEHSPIKELDNLYSVRFRGQTIRLTGSVAKLLNALYDQDPWSVKTQLENIREYLERLEAMVPSIK